jgi:hypothetical protein
MERSPCSGVSSARTRMEQVPDQPAAQVLMRASSARDAAHVKSPRAWALFPSLRHAARCHALAAVRR